MSSQERNNRIQAQTKMRGKPFVMSILVRVMFLVPSSLIVGLMSGYTLTITIQEHPRWLVGSIAFLLLSQIAAYYVLKNSLWATFYAGITSYLESVIADQPSPPSSSSSG